MDNRPFILALLFVPPRFPSLVERLRRRRGLPEVDVDADDGGDEDDEEREADEEIISDEVSVMRGSGHFVSLFECDYCVC